MKLKTFTSYFLALSASFIMLNSGCAKDEITSNNCNWETEYQLYQQKVNAYILNQSSANCSSLKSSALTLLSKLEKCNTSEAASIKSAAEQWKQINCN